MFKSSFRFSKNKIPLNDICKQNKEIEESLVDSIDSIDLFVFAHFSLWQSILQISFYYLVVKFTIISSKI